MRTIKRISAGVGSAALATGLAIIATPGAAMAQGPALVQNCSPNPPSYAYNYLYGSCPSSPGIYGEFRIAFEYEHLGIVYDDHLVWATAPGAQGHQEPSSVTVVNTWYEFR